MGQVMAKILVWQLGNPGATKDACISWLDKERHSGGLIIDEGTSEPASKRARTK